MSTEGLDAFAALIERHMHAAPAVDADSRDWGGHLLSPERAQRFELLMHLVANLGQPLVVCGPEGIGKTTFLGVLGERAFETWQVISVQADNRLQHGDIIARIAECAAVPIVSEAAVAEYLQRQAYKNNMSVLLLDEAGKLAAGVIDALWQFVRSYPALRLVLALRPDEIHLKTASDGVALANCHFVDIPVLSESDCAAFLRRLASRQPRTLALEDVTAARVRTLYQASHGVPGRIIQLLNATPASRDPIRRGKLVLTLAAFCAAVLAVALVAFWYLRPAVPVSGVMVDMTAPRPLPEPELAGTVPDRPTPVAVPVTAAISSVVAVAAAKEEERKKTVAVPSPPSPPVAETKVPGAVVDKLQSTALSAGSGPAIGGTGAPISTPASAAAQPALLPREAEPVEGADQLGLASPILSGRASQDSGELRQDPTPVPEAGVRPDAGQGKTGSAATAPHPPAVPAAAHAPPAAGLGIAGLHDSDWLLSQPPHAYTLRIMSARELASLKTLLERYPTMTGRLAAFKRRSGGADWYQVFYGIFASESEARQASEQLPASLGRPVSVPLKTVQQELRAAR